MFPKPCMDCHKLYRGRGERCEDCRLRVSRAREADPNRRAYKRNLYNAEYKAKAKAIKNFSTHCHICKEAFTDRAQISADHLRPGDPTSPLAPAHLVCNARRGNRW